MTGAWIKKSLWKHVLIQRLLSKEAITDYSVASSAFSSGATAITIPVASKKSPD
jgi:hypothetical protein